MHGWQRENKRVNPFNRHIILAILLSPVASKSYSEPANDPMSKPEDIAALLEFIGGWHHDVNHQGQTKKWLDPLSLKAIQNDQIQSNQPKTESKQPEPDEAITDE